MTPSTLTLAPGTSPVPGTGANVEPHPCDGFRPSTTRDHIALRAATDDVHAWLHHIAPAAGCTRPVRLTGYISTIEAATGRLLAQTDTATMPDGLIYKPCGNRRASVCPSCARTYQRDAYQLLRAGLIGGKGVPASVSLHPAVFATFTAPSFGTVHTRVVKRHTCESRQRCDCRAEPCHARRTTGLCQHGRPAVCFARHETSDTVLGRAMCLDCYDYGHHVVWNLSAGELWRRTKQAAERHLNQLAKLRGHHTPIVYTGNGKPRTLPIVRLSHGKAAEFQVRGAVHFHALVRLDGVNPNNPDAIVPPPPGFSSTDLQDAIEHAAAQVAFDTPTHPDQPAGWHIVWGNQLDIKHITLAGHSEVTDSMVAGYLAKYATKSTEVTGHHSTRLSADRIDAYADPEGDHTARLIDACWQLGRPTHTPPPLSQRPARPRPVTQFGPRWTCPDCAQQTRLTICPACTPPAQPPTDTAPPTEPDHNPYTRLRRWAHMLGFGGHFLTKARRYSVTFALLRATRTEFRRTTDNPDCATIRTAEHLDEETTLIIGTLTFAGAGWHNTGDAILANTSAAMARARQQTARDELAHEHGSARLAAVQSQAA